MSRRWTFSWAWLLGAVLASGMSIGAKGCGGKQCEQLKTVMIAACAASSTSFECTTATAAYQAAGCKESCDALKTAYLAACSADKASDACRAAKDTYVKANCGCVETCQEGTRCKNSVCVPVEKTPEPVCQPNQNCDCYVKLEGTDDWRLMSCTAPKRCVNFVCQAPEPTCPLTCPDGQTCTDPAVGCVPETPPATGCNIDGEPGPILPNYINRHGNAVNLAIKTLYPSCEIGGHCVITDRPQVYQRKVSAQLRKQGYCAGQHTPETDEIAAATDSRAAREGFHIYAGAGWDDPSANGTVVWAPGSARGAYAAPDGPVPPTGSCSAPLPPRVWTAETLPRGWGENAIGTPRWVINCKPHGRVIDCTHLVTPHACGYCASIGMGELDPGVPRCVCPTRPDGHPDRVACEDYIAEGKLVLESRNNATCVRKADTMFEPNGGNCRLCNPAKTVCGAWF